MNERFYMLAEEKQKAIINAAYKVFAQNDYKKAPMSEIAAEGGISKSLLFHYFTNKLELYLFLWEKAMHLTSQAMKEYHVMETKDFFEMLSRSLYAKCFLMGRFPYLSLFALQAYYEKEPKVKEKVQESFAMKNQNSLRLVLEQIDPSNLREGFSVEEIYQEILYASDGFLLEKYRSGKVDAEEIQQEYETMIMFWKKTFGKEEVL